MLNTPVTILLNIVLGAGLELGVHALSGRREAWDSPAFWTLGMPIVLLVSVGIGLLSRGRAWLAALAIAPAQAATMMVRSGEIGSLWPLTIVLSSILSAPFVAAAFAGSRLRRRVPPVPARPLR